MEKKENNYSIIFTSLDEYENNEDYNNIFETINSTQRIIAQQEVLKLFSQDEEQLEIYSYTRT